ncbi:hypothetical protein GCM10010472_18410 [Pseudonocardia halophobica]|uniref:Antibiotic biosynthesis monooxygenase n=1 Tax=Pseudonocardia halophobica TaxID=29401 RepID=A0A9W6KZD9_9PSEU|nr:hypothetical protein [Pseudonocardia halophobica]GLL09945.1 hypothetical protein GCM10017577_10850 [Pseudonocardia halophobica]
MTVIVITTLHGVTADGLREANRTQDATMQRIVEDARSKGCRHHVFAEAEDGSVVVFDEWTSREDFESFFGGQREIPDVMRAAGASATPTAASYTIIETTDSY